VSGKPIEIQVRTPLQHLWAELSEKSSDVFDPAIKYGGGPDEWRNLLTRSSEMVASYEEHEKAYFGAVASAEVAVVDNEMIRKAARKLLDRHILGDTTDEIQGKLEDSTHAVERLEQFRDESRERMLQIWTGIAYALQMLNSWLDHLGRRKS